MKKFIFGMVVLFAASSASAGITKCNGKFNLDVIGLSTNEDVQLSWSGTLQEGTVLNLKSRWENSFPVLSVSELNDKKSFELIQDCSIRPTLNEKMECSASFPESVEWKKMLPRIIAVETLVAAEGSLPFSLQNVTLARRFELSKPNKYGSASLIEYYAQERLVGRVFNFGTGMAAAIECGSDIQSGL